MIENRGELPRDPESRSLQYRLNVQECLVVFCRGCSHTDNAAIPRQVA